MIPPSTFEPTNGGASGTYTSYRRLQLEGTHAGDTHRHPDGRVRHRRATAATLIQDQSGTNAMSSVVWIAAEIWTEPTMIWNWTTSSRSGLTSKVLQEMRILERPLFSLR